MLLFTEKHQKSCFEVSGRVMPSIASECIDLTSQKTVIFIRKSCLKKNFEGIYKSAILNITGVLEASCMFGVTVAA